MSDTRYRVRNVPVAIRKEFAEACEKQGMKIGPALAKAMRLLINQWKQEN